MCGPYSFDNSQEVSAEGSSSKVDYVSLVNDEEILFCEAKSPSVMKSFGEELPPRGFQLEWTTSPSIVRKILGNVSMLCTLLMLVLTGNV
jgi:hypothetical protein